MTAPQAIDPRFDLAPPAASVRAWLYLLVVALPLAITALPMLVGMASGGRKQLAAIDAGGHWLVVMGAVFAFTLALAAIIDRVLRRHRLAIDDDGIEIATTFYQRRLPLSQLELARARVVDLGERSEFRPLLKTNGLSLPGVRSGRFRLRNLHKAFVAMAAGPRVLWIPTRDGDELLLQPRSPQALLDHLRALAAPAPRS